MHLPMLRLRKTVAAGDVERRHQRFAVGKQKKRDGRDGGNITHGVKLRGVGKDDQQHTDAFQQVEQPSELAVRGLVPPMKGSSFAPQDRPGMAESRLLGAK